MLKRDQWLPLARKLDWEFSYVEERDVFPEIQSGTTFLVELPLGAPAPMEVPARGQLELAARVQ